MLNVEDIKPLEVPFSFAMDLAWNASSIDLDSIPDWLEAFSAREFGTEAAEEAASVLLAYSHLVGLRKYEMTTEATYSVLNYREAERVLDAWTALASRARALHEGLAEDRRDALFHHIVYPVVAGALYNAIMINRGRNQQFVAERRNSANDLVETLLDDFGADFDLTVEYDTLAGGKWQGIMSTPKYDIGIDTWRPPSRDVLLNVSYVQTRQDFDYGFGNLGIYAQGSRSAWNQGRICASADPAFPTDGSFSPKLPLLTPYGPSFVVVDLFHRGDHRKDVVWSLDVPYDWLRFSSTSGALSGDQAEQRLNISVDWDAVPEGFDEAFAVRIDWEPAPYFDDLIVAVANQRVPDDFSGFAEVDGIISIEAPHFQRASEEDVAFQTMPRLASRSDSGSIALRPFGEAREDAEAARGAWVEYDIYLFGDKGGDLNVTLYVTGALDTDPDLPLMYSLTVDGGEGDLARLLEDPEAVGELPPDWEHHVADSVWIRTVGLGSVEAGQHTLRWSVNSPELYLEKLVVQFNKTAPSSYLGPPESQQI